MSKPNFFVLDNFLSADEHAQIWRSFSDLNFAPFNVRSWNQVYRLTDGVCLVGDHFHILAPSLRDNDDELPGPSPLRVLFERLSHLMAGDSQPLNIGQWSGFSATPYIYPPGAGLGWHNDDKELGSYIYYCHPRWESSWGGELLVSDEAPTDYWAAQNGDSARFPSFFDPRGVAETVCSSGGRFLYPRPNRLVLLRGGALHCIKKVDPAAGEAFRASLTGFFLREG